MKIVEINQAVTRLRADFPAATVEFGVTIRLGLDRYARAASPPLLRTVRYMAHAEFHGRDGALVDCWAFGSTLAQSEAKLREEIAARRRSLAKPVPQDIELMARLMAGSAA